MEAPNPNFQTLNNQGDDENSLLHLTFNHPDDKINVTLATQNLRLNLPNMPSEQTVGVNQWQRENNILGVFSLRHYFSENLEMLFGLSFLGSHQAVGNNGIFNPWIPEIRFCQISADVFPFGIHGRQSRFITDVKLGFRNRDFEGSFSVLNLFNNRRILNLLSNYSGTRFVEERRFLIDLTKILTADE